MTLLAGAASGTPTAQAVTALVTIVVAVLSLAGTVTVGLATSRATRRAADQASRNEFAKIEAQRVNDLRGDVEQARKDRAEDRRIFTEELAQIREQHAAEIERWRARVLQLDERHQACERRLAQLQEWARVVRRVLGEPDISAALIQGDYAIPPTPRGFGLMDTDPGWRRPPPREP